MALVGVFNGPGPAGTESWQVFQIGSTDSLTVPAGVTTLYLGIADALGFNDVPGDYNDNTGSFCVSTTGGCGAPTIPEPATWAMLLLGFGSLGYAAMRKGQEHSPTPA